MPTSGILVLLSLLALVSCTQALAILLPLYIYPSDGCSAWSSAFSAISAQPSTTFYIIVNPNSGPGSAGSQPDANFVQCVPKLRPAASKTIILGYVLVTDPTSGSVTSDIDTYAGWHTAYQPDGIYLDAISPEPNLLSTNQGYVSHARSAGFTFMALGPGESVPSSYLDMADLVTTYESSYSSFNAASVSGTLSKQAVILVNATSTGSYSSTIDKLKSMGVAAVYISDASDDSQNLPVQLSEFVDEVASAGGSSTPSGVTSSAPQSSARGSLNQSSTSASSSVGSKTASSSSPSASTSSPSASSSVPPTAGISQNKKKASTPVAAIVGSILGIAVLLLGILLVYKSCARRRRQRTSAGTDPEPYPLPRAEASFNLPSVLNGTGHSPRMHVKSALLPTETRSSGLTLSPVSNATSHSPRRSHIKGVDREPPSTETPSSGHGPSSGRGTSDSESVVETEIDGAPPPSYVSHDFRT
ncbi:Spherulation-specific family 4-domain-containing protein [Roridomyces roridus]|uniref:Spherulation-specific family 4-domain-containing protein n=1 Tax=Roridomyces roridus TaxID=1738132 RepID=A0AAD7FER9_9AGAR|nr:Spherulation-specific family 4-domain-containing protein [Roridomyces roridus]